MQIIEEGTITIQPDGSVFVQGFHVDGGSVEELWAEVGRRVALAAAYVARQVNTSIVGSSIDANLIFFRSASEPADSP